MKLVFATHNQNKIEEVRAILPDTFTLLSLDDIGCTEEIPETGETLAENAKIKADYVTQTYGLNCFSDDTGLIIDALNGAPGVYSARYASEHKNAKDNMTKVLEELKDEYSRTARFKTIVHLNLMGESHVFEGAVEGWITKQMQGSGGFGYDPIFRPEGYDQTFGELPTKVKNTISHRGRAIQSLVEFLKKETF
ncbi:non-canonical purine NTP diphosphatase [Flagellimonas allohymeniacidonis]|uniref:dITP/XTP pyrophosphatase n=1 Tax=Flagellimonas allohymeniacidonis TaxID=2517819 RepID=A0A4Q8QGT1_9FLAO|nr:non-canonical purine NTP diphosphatase [Allomuricauda hymeniacidonis]TAI49124.1 non-canonical purine NTP diphosphatase [Allomuricauda hymeniacidonis]